MSNSTGEINISIIKVFQMLFDQLQSGTRRKLVFLFGLMTVGSFAEVVSLSMLMPVVIMFTNPTSITESYFFKSYFFEIDIAYLKLVLISLFLFSVLTAGVIKFWVLRSVAKFSLGTSSELASKIFRVSMYHEYQYHLNTNSSLIIDGIGQKINATIYAGLLPVLNLISSGAIILSSILFLAYVNILAVFAIFFGFAIFYLLTIYLLKKRISQLSEIFPLKSTAALKVVQEGLGDIRSVIIGNIRALYVKKFESYDYEYKNAQREALIYAGFPKILIEVLLIVFFVMLIAYLDFNSFDLKSILPTLAVFVFAAQKLLPLIQSVYSSYTSMMSAKHAILDIIQLLKEPATKKKKVAKRPLHLKSYIELKDVGFKYLNSDLPILSNISLKIYKGERIGICGKSGSGKSTLCDIMMGLLNPTSGQFYIDKTLVNTNNINLYRKLVGQVPQNVFLSDSDFYENIAVGSSNSLSPIEKERIEFICNTLKLKNFIDNLEKGFNTPVGERGIKLSGGQRQRLGIARALYSNPSILFLDEITSALDKKTSKEVIDVIYGLSDVTIIIVSHDSSTLDGCDRLLTLESGSLV